MVETSKCSECKNHLPVSMFYELSRGGYSNVCKPCKPKRDKRYRQQNPNTHRRANRKWYSSNRTYRSVTVSEYRETEQGRAVQKRAKANRRNKTADPCYSLQELESRVYMCGRRCFYCNSLVDSLTVDHIVPLSKGGLDIISNIVGSCLKCNQSKGARNLEDWYREQPFFSPHKLKLARLSIKGVNIDV